MTETNVIVAEALLTSVIASEAPRAKQSPAPFPVGLGDDRLPIHQQHPKREGGEKKRFGGFTGILCQQTLQVPLAPRPSEGWGGIRQQYPFREENGLEDERGFYMVRSYALRLIIQGPPPIKRRWTAQDSYHED